MPSIWNTPGTLANQFWERGWDFENPDTAPIPIYDMHGHMGSHNAIYFARCEADDMVKHLKRIGVRRLVFSHHHALWGNMSNSEVHDIVAKHADILRFYVSVVPHRQAQIQADIANFDKMAPLAIGFKLLPDYHRTPANAPQYAPVLEFANERELPVLVHTWGGSPNNGAKVMLDVALRYPKIKLLLGHSIREEWDGVKRIAEQCPNAYFELTSIPGHSGMLEKLMSIVGSKRMIFGTDLPWFDEFQHVGGVLAADIPEEAKHDILYRNVERMLGKDW